MIKVLWSDAASTLTKYRDQKETTFICPKCGEESKVTLEYRGVVLSNAHIIAKAPMQVIPNCLVCKKCTTAQCVVCGEEIGACTCIKNVVPAEFLTSRFFKECE